MSKKYQKWHQHTNSTADAHKLQLFVPCLFLFLDSERIFGRDSKTIDNLLHKSAPIVLRGVRIVQCAKKRIQASDIVHIKIVFVRRLLHARMLAGFKIF